MDKDVVAATGEALAPFGEFYESQGVRFFRALNSRVGVRSDKVKAFSGVAEKVIAVAEGWMQVKLQREEKLFIIHHNWIKSEQWLKAGEAVEGVLYVGEEPPRAWYIKRAVTQAAEVYPVVSSIW